MDVKKVLSDNNIDPVETMDQFFLNSDDILNREIDLAGLESSDTVLEIGAGPGNLTEKIAKKARVIAIERDRRFMPLLEKIANAEIICDDAAKVIDKLEFNKIISNIPYHISKKLMLKILNKKWETAVLIVQKEFAEKMMNNSKLALLVEDSAEMSIIENIPGSGFYPPAVESALVVLRQKKLMDRLLWNFLNELFRHKNKDVKNVVKNCPDSLARKKVQHLALAEIKELYERNK